MDTHIYSALSPVSARDTCQEHVSSGIKNTHWISPPMPQFPHVTYVFISTYRIASALSPVPRCNSHRFVGCRQLQAGRHKQSRWQANKHWKVKTEWETERQTRGGGGEQTIALYKKNGTNNGIPRKSYSSNSLTENKIHKIFNRKGHRAFKKSFHNTMNKQKFTLHRRRQKHKEQKLSNNMA